MARDKDLAVFLEHNGININRVASAEALHFHAKQKFNAADRHCWQALQSTSFWAGLFLGWLMSDTFVLLQLLQECFSSDHLMSTWQLLLSSRGTLGHWYFWLLGIVFLTGCYGVIASPDMCNSPGNVLLFHKGMPCTFLLLYGISVYTLSF